MHVNLNFQLHSTVEVVSCALALHCFMEDNDVYIGECADLEKLDYSYSLVALGPECDRKTKTKAHQRSKAKNLNNEEFAFDPLLHVNTAWGGCYI